MDIKAYIESGIIEQYVLGMCGPAEAAELEQLRKQYPELHAAVLQYEEELEKRMLSEPVLPSADVDEKILNRLKLLNTPAPVVITETPVRKINLSRLIAAAAILLLFVCGYFIYSLNQKANLLEKELAEIKKSGTTLPSSDYQVLNNPAITPVAMYGVGIHSICRCTMFWDKRTGKIYIYIHHLPRSSETQDYQLWAMVGGQPVNVGIINDSVRGRLIEMQHVPEGAVAFSVTLENAGGSSQQPGNDVYLQGSI
jgi:anti-sigma-K factor RskA